MTEQKIVFKCQLKGDVVDTTPMGIGNSGYNIEGYTDCSAVNCPNSFKPKFQRFWIVSGDRPGDVSEAVDNEVTSQKINCPIAQAELQSAG